MRTIPNTETLDVEFKSDLKCYPDHDLIEEIVGMTNTIGGVLYLGVEDVCFLCLFYERRKNEKQKTKINSDCGDRSCCGHSSGWIVLLKI